MESDVPLLGAGALEARVSNERAGDGRYRPLKSCLGLWLLERVLLGFSRRPQTSSAWKRLIAAAARAPAPEDLLDLGDAALFNPPSMREAIDRHLRRKKAPPPRNLSGYTRLICDSLGRDHARAMAAFEGMIGRKFRRILMVGGGARNRLLAQATADAGAVPVVCYRLEGTAVGNLARQFVALGAVRNLRAFRRHLAGTLIQTVHQPGGRAGRPGPPVGLGATGRRALPRNVGNRN